MTTDVLDLTKQFVSIPSVYPHESELCDTLVEALRQRNATVQTQGIGNGRNNVFATFGKGTRAIMFYGHIDTVPVTNAPQWDSDPFVPTERNGKLYGLGAYDMKAGLAAAISAATISGAYVKCMFAVDEENISEGAWAALEKKGSFFDDVELIISAEPNFGAGLHGITRGRSGRCIFEVHISGKPVHIAEYRDGVDAIQRLAEVTGVLYDHRDEIAKSTGTVLQVRRVAAESVGMSVCGEAELEIEALLAPGTTVYGLASELSTLLGVEVAPKPRKTPYLTGYEFDSFPWQDAVERIIGDATGQTVAYQTRRSVGDDNVLATHGIPVITWGPDGGAAHSPNEYVDIDSVFALTQMYTALLEHKRSEEKV